MDVHIDMGVNCRHTALVAGMDNFFNRRRGPVIKYIIYNYPATIVFWADGTKTVVKVSRGDCLDREKGVLLAYMKKVYGQGYYRELVRKITEAKSEESPT